MENEKIENYKILGIRKRKSKKSDNEYYLCYVLYENNYGFDILNVIVNEKQVGALESVINDDTFELKKFMNLQYNSFTKRYDMRITFGL